ncbi:MAG: AMP-binding protein, partial [Pseudomonadota bacterium]
MSENDIYPVSDELAAKAHIDAAKYREMYDRSVADPDSFWAECGQRLDWVKQPTIIKNSTYEYPDVSIKWYEDGTLNVSANCIDRHLETRGDQVAIIWEGDDPGDDLKITYRELHGHVCRLANAMKDMGVKKGDRVTLYMPMVPEAAYAMLACTRIGAIHSIVFGGFSPDALAQRVVDCESSIIITADEGLRGGKKVPLKANADAAIHIAATQGQQVEHVLVVQRTKGAIEWEPGRDIWYHEATQAASADCPPEEMNAEDPLFILYTSGSTGTPKGVLHTTGGYLVWAAMTHEYVFDYHEGDIYWCT